MIIYSAVYIKKSFKIILLLVIFYSFFPITADAGQFKVRLAGIDAHETPKKKKAPGQPYSQKAKKYLAGLVLNKVVVIKSYGLGRYNRVLGVIHLNGKNINLEIVNQGLAEVYRGSPPHGFDPAPYRNTEREARAAKRGMWSLGDNYVSPKEWRKMQRWR